MKKILYITGDSLACSRQWDGISLNKIYSTLLSNHSELDLLVINNSVARNTTREILNSYPTMQALTDPSIDYHVIQLGVVDCYPRLFSNRKREVLNFFSKIPYLQKIVTLYIKQKSKHREHLTNKKLIQKVPPERFQENLASIIQKILSSEKKPKIFIINIAAPGDFLIEKSRRIKPIVKKYNQIINNLSKNHNNQIKIIDFYSQTTNDPELLLADGHHLSPAAHQQLANEIAKLIQQDYADITSPDKSEQ